MNIHDVLVLFKELMTDHKEVYRTEADQYEKLISREDYQRNILREINRIAPLSGLDVVDLGAGTGRLTCLVVPQAANVYAFDISQAMLDIARQKLHDMRLTNWLAQVADNRHIPMPDASVDLVLSGWSLCYLADWGDSHWQDQLYIALAEMKRVLRPEGTIILLETQGTGFETPHPPPHLHEYFRELDVLQFQNTWFRTDYEFQNNEEAVTLTRFFFGDELAESLQANDSVFLPECTGIYWISRKKLKIPGKKP